MEEQNTNKGWLTKKNIIIGAVGLIVIIAIMSTCGGGSDKKAEEDTTEQKNESREMGASTIEIKGIQAGLFKVEGNYKLSLVKSKDDGWVVRAKIPFVKAKDFDSKKYDCKVSSVSGDLIDASDVELESLDFSESDIEGLLVKNIGEVENVTCSTWSYKNMSYNAAKKIYDEVQGIVISDIKLKELPKDEKKGKQSIMDDSDLKEVKEVLEAEKQLLDVLF